MALNIRDKEIDRKLEEIVLMIKNDFGIHNVSKSDAIRYLLKIRRQNKSQKKTWDRLFQ